MKNIAQKSFILFVMLLIMLNAVIFNVSAAKYVENVVADFDNSSECEFLSPGDLNADKSVNSLDVASIKTMLLTQQGSLYEDIFASNSDAKYADVNGDGYINLIDLVRQKKNLANNFVFAENGIINLNGQSAYKGEFLSVLGTGASYKLKFSYKADTDIKVVINGLDKEIVYENSANEQFKEVEYIFKTPLSIEQTNEIELKIIGIGTIKDFTVTRVNMDNILSENW